MFLASRSVSPSAPDLYTRSDLGAVKRKKAGNQGGWIRNGKQKNERKTDRSRERERERGGDRNRESAHPARSTRCSLERRTTAVASWRPSIMMVKMQWERDDTRFIDVSLCWEVVTGSAHRNAHTSNRTGTRVSKRECVCVKRERERGRSMEERKAPPDGAIDVAQEQQVEGIGLGLGQVRTEVDKVQAPVRVFHAPDARQLVLLHGLVVVPDQVVPLLAVDLHVADVDGVLKVHALPQDRGSSI